MTLASDLAACDRETGLHGSLYSFVKMAWPQVFPASPLQENWHLPLLCEHYEAAFKGEIKELVVNLPPGGSKSSLTCVMLPSWGWLQDPAYAYVFAAYGQNLVVRDATAMFKLMSSKWWTARWPDRFTLPTVPAMLNITNSKTGFRFGTTPGAQVTGFHGNMHVYDDPNKPEDLTKVGLEGVRDWYARTMSTRFRRPPAVNTSIVIMQRLHCDDLAQTFLDQGAVHICLPAEFDPSRRTVTSWGRDPRTEQGELLDPVRAPKAFLDPLRKRLGPLNAAAQLDQAPVPEGGAVFKRDGLRFWSTNAVSVMQGVDIGGIRFKCAPKPASFDMKLDSWDCAFKDDETTSDPVCGQHWWLLGPDFFLMDQRHGHFDFFRTIEKILDLRRSNLPANLILIEDKANGPAIINTLKKQIPGVLEVDPKGGKTSRANATSGYVESGNVFLPDPGMGGFAWVSDLLIPELLSFPRAKHDDQVDCLTQAIQYMLENTNYLKAAMTKVRQMACPVLE